MNKTSITLIIFFWCLVLLSSIHLSAQNLEAIGHENPLKVTGGVNFNNIVYAAKGIKARRDPYSYFLTGNLNLDIYNWVVPFSFTVSNQNNSFQQPFNQFSLHPSYKWITAHVGYTSMTFSPYTLNGHLFKGIGVDLTPEGKFKFNAMYGRLQKAVTPDTLLQDGTNAAFKRMGYAMKASYLSGGNSLDLILFRAKDEINSIAYVPEDKNILPMENLVLSIAGGKTLFTKLLVQVEFATSAMTRDIRSNESKSNNKNIFSFAGPLYTQRSSSSYYNAFKSGLSYQGKDFTVGVGYEHVAPGYRTLGAYYFNNDLESVTMNATKVLVNGKLNIAANGGVQHDNLDNSKISTMRRLVGSVNVGYTPSERLNLAASYSNFNTYTNIRTKFVDINQLTPYDNLDTLNYTQLSQSSNVNANYLFPSKNEKRQSINLSVAMQKAADKQGGVEQNSGSVFYNFNANYNLNFIPRNFAVSVALNYNQNKMATLTTTTLGPTLGLRKSFLDKKLASTISSSLNNAYTNNQLMSRVVNIRLGGNYTVEKKHHVALSLVVLNRINNKQTATEKFTEFTGTLGYSYSF